MTEECPVTLSLSLNFFGKECSKVGNGSQGKLLTSQPQGNSKFCNILLVSRKDSTYHFCLAGFFQLGVWHKAWIFSLQLLVWYSSPEGRLDQGLRSSTLKDRLWLFQLLGYQKWNCFCLFSLRLGNFWKNLPDESFLGSTFFYLESELSTVISTQVPFKLMSSSLLMRLMLKTFILVGAISAWRVSELQAVSVNKDHHISTMIELGLWPIAAFVPKEIPLSIGQKKFYLLLAPIP